MLFRSIGIRESLDASARRIRHDGPIISAIGSGEMPAVRIRIEAGSGIGPIMLAAHVVAERSDDGVNNSALKSPTELVIAALWQEALGMDEVVATDNFFDSGGHSLLAMQLARGIRERFPIEFALRDLFARPQLRELAAYVDQQMAGATAQMEVVRDEPARGFEYGEI